MIIADTNLITYLFIDGERTLAAERVWELDSDWLMPPLWRSEFLNVPTTGVQVELFTLEQALSMWWRAGELLPRNDREPSGEGVLRTAAERRISADDAHFVVLAAELGVPLITAEREIVQRCPDVAVSIEDFAARKSTQFPDGWVKGRDSEEIFCPSP